MNLALGNFLCQITKLGAVDLHVHSTASDGSYTPQEVLALAKRNQLSYLALTDHDTIAGSQELIKSCPTLDSYLKKNKQDLNSLLAQNKNQLLDRPVLLIPGIEFSLIFENQEIHLLAYYSGLEIEKLNDFMEKQRKARFQRNRKMIARLRDLNIPIPLDELDPTSEQAVTGRVKVAKWLVTNQYVDSIAQAFSKFLGPGKKAYVPRKRIELSQALDIISRSNGFPVIAHPHQYGWTVSEELLDQKIASILKFAPIGIEVYHSDASLAEQKLALAIAEKYSLAYTAGSDFHGVNKEKHHLYSALHKPENHFGKIKDIS